MVWRTAVPREIREEVASWGLPRKLVIQLYTELHELAPKHEDVCMRLAAPSPTYVYVFDLIDDNRLPIVVNVCTFWFTYGEQDGVLYARDCHHSEEPLEE